jgi:hypothetical protein
LTHEKCEKRLAFSHHVFDAGPPCEKVRTQVRTPKKLTATEDPSEIDIESIDDEKKRSKVQDGIAGLENEDIDWAGCALLEEYINEEMSGAHCILDKDGNATAAYIYDIAG